MASPTRHMPWRCAYVHASATSSHVRDLSHYAGQRLGHYVCVPASSASDRGLLLFLPGTAPSMYKLIAQTAADAGYHTISLSWVNHPSAECVVHGCKNPHIVHDEALINCTRQVALMRFFGASTSTPSNCVGYTLDPPNAVHDRAVALLRHLAKNASSLLGSDHWQRYLDCSGTKLQWTEVSVGGHSRARCAHSDSQCPPPNLSRTRPLSVCARLSRAGGSYYPVLLSKRIAFRRALLFGGPGQLVVGECRSEAPMRAYNDCYPPFGFGVGRWVLEQSKVPVHRWFGLMAAYRGDACSIARPAWAALGLRGAATVDSATARLPSREMAAALGGAHQIFDRGVCVSSNSPHMCLVADASTPLDRSGRPLLAQLWNFMLTSEDEPSATALETEAGVNCTMVVPNLRRMHAPALRTRSSVSGNS